MVVLCEVFRGHLLVLLLFFIKTSLNLLNSFLFFFSLCILILTSGLKSFVYQYFLKTNLVYALQENGVVDISFSKLDVDNRILILDCLGLALELLPICNFILLSHQVFHLPEENSSQDLLSAAEEAISWYGLELHGEIGHCNGLSFILCDVCLLAAV